MSEESWRTAFQEAIDDAYRRGLAAGRGQAGSRKLKALPGPALTDRQMEIARLAAEGRTNAEIGQRVFVSENSVKTHLRVVFRKTGARSRAHLASMLVAHGQASPRED